MRVRGPTPKRSSPQGPEVPPHRGWQREVVGGGPGAPASTERWRISYPNFFISLSLCYVSVRTKGAREQRPAPGWYNLHVVGAVSRPGRRWGRVNRSRGRMLE